MMAVKPRKTTLAGHTAGIFADMTLDGPEIGTLVAVVDRARNLPNRKTMGKQDPYCAMRLGKEAKKTDTDRRGGQTPKWDQELRFTVHESPDYYKLKCSVFNDDKKTDLIGEVWIDLSDLIKPGGGSNDLWHNLNYKGKYAGDVRIELTYYDLRPREEKAAEKRRLKESSMVKECGDNKICTPRQLGPREVRRRPLPASPASTTPTQTPPPVTSSILSPSTAFLTQADAPTVPPKLPLSYHETSMVVQHDLPPEEEQLIFNPYADDFPAVQPTVQQYRQPFCEDLSPTVDRQIELGWSIGDDGPTQRSAHASLRSSQSAISPMSQPDETDTWDMSQYSQPHLPAPLELEYHTTPHTLPSPPNESSDIHCSAFRSHTLPAKPMSHRDSPLRHSMTQQENLVQFFEEPASYNAKLPPPPPLHRETPPRRVFPEYPPSSFPNQDQSLVAFAPRMLETDQRRRSTDNQWSNQHASQDQGVELAVSARSYSSVDNLDSQRTYRDRQVRPLRNTTNDHHYATPGRQSSYNSYQDQSSPITQRDHREDDPFFPEDAHTPAYQKPVYREEPEAHEDRRFSGHISPGEDHREKLHLPSSPSNFPVMAEHRPQAHRPQSATNASNHVPQRKAISPGSQPDLENRRLSASPYGPDAYDVLNPATSPIANEGTKSQSSGQAKELARMREVSRLRDQGPIIGNDGRVIDPSDHLPSDTWAPEPERKNRRPEHVVHVRTKNDTRSHTITNSSSQPPHDVRRQRQGAVVPHSSTTSTSLAAGRNRLHKQPPPQQLRAQPYSQARSEQFAEPRLEFGRNAALSSQYAAHRHSYHEIPQGLHRPQLSEYQVPASNSYVPRGFSQHDAYPSSSPRTSAQERQGSSASHAKNYDNRLAAEMNMIDIGPSRGQMVLSHRRGY